jgi:hypothetical protein
MAKEKSTRTAVWIMKPGERRDFLSEQGLLDGEDATQARSSLSYSVLWTDHGLLCSAREPTHSFS